MLKKIFLPLMLSLSCAFLLAACGGSDTSSTTNSSNTTVANKTATTSTPSAPATTTATATPSSTTPASGDKIGVAECDDYLTKLEACLSKLPAVAKEQYEKTLAQTRTRWRELASSPQGKAGLEQACMMATNQSKQTMKPYGCDF